MTPHPAVGHLLLKEKERSRITKLIEGDYNKDQEEILQYPNRLE